jgi:hypothetical protein
MTLATLSKTGCDSLGKHCLQIVYAERSFAAAYSCSVQGLQAAAEALTRHAHKENTNATCLLYPKPCRISQLSCK